jgi:hypothetical protein
LPSCRIDVHHSVSYAEVRHLRGTEIRSEPIWIQFLVNTSNPQLLNFLSVQLNTIVVLLHVVLVLLETLDELRVESVEPHLHVGKLADRKRLKVLK